MSERKALGGGDWLAIGTFLVGALVAVLMGMALWRGVEAAQGTGALAAVIAGVLGALPGLVLGAGVAFLGGRAFLTGDPSRIARGAAGTLGVALGLAILVGAFSADGGGAVGAAIGGRAAALTHAAVGALLGALVVFGAAWFAWLRVDPALAAKLAPPRRATSAPPRTEEGVSAAESAMLFPAEAAPVEALAPAAEPAPAAAQTKPAAAQVLTPHPYPEDVRLKGEIPPGTRPLGEDTVAASAAAPEAPPAVYRWTSPRAPAATPIPMETDEGLQPLEGGAELADEVAEAPPELDVTELEVTELEATELEPVDLDLKAIEDEEVEAAEPLRVEEEVVEPVELRPMPPRPSWETTGLAEEDEPVDAYGTPISLVERVRRERDDGAEADETATVAARIPREVDALDDEDLADGTAAEDDEAEILLELHPDGVNGHDLAPGRGAARDRGLLDAELDAEAVSEDADLDADAIEIEAVVVDAEEAEEDLDDDEAVDEELEGIVGGLHETEDDAEEADEVLAHEEDLEAEEDEDLAEEEQDEVGLGEAEADLDDEPEDEQEDEAEADAEVRAASDADVDEDAAPAPEPVSASAPRQPASARAKPAVRSLFDADEDAPAQREVVLQPQAAVPPERAEKSPASGLDPRQKLLVEVGCMFVERGRVAVSMLQRQYDMDFDEACRVLDELQEMGLIGPYLGGQRRDILLSRDQWLQKVGSA